MDVFNRFQCKDSTYIPLHATDIQEYGTIVPNSPLTKMYPQLNVHVNNKFLHASSKLQIATDRHDIDRCIAKKILTLDFNSLYMYALSSSIYTGPVLLLSKEENFIPVNITTQPVFMAVVEEYLRRLLTYDKCAFSTDYELVCMKHEEWIYHKDTKQAEKPYRIDIVVTVRCRSSGQEERIAIELNGKYRSFFWMYM